MSDVRWLSEGRTLPRSTAAAEGEADIDHYIKEGLSPTEIMVQHPELKEQVEERYAEGKYHAATHSEYFRQLAAKNLAEAWEKFGGPTLAARGKADFKLFEARRITPLSPGSSIEPTPATGCSSRSTGSITGSIVPHHRTIVSRISGSPTASTTRFSSMLCEIGR